MNSMEFLRPLHRRAWVFTAVFTAGWAGSAGAAGSPSPASCLEDLAACTDDRQQCENQLWLTGRAGGDCHTEATGTAAALADCQTLLTSSQSDLAACSAALTACQALGFPATGQVTAYSADRSDGVPGPVPVADDGALEAGAELTYTDNGDGTITDLRTGLMWEKKSDDGGLHDKDNGYWWSGNGDQETVWDWLADVNAEGPAGFAGHSDWRIPNVRELHSLVNYEVSGVAISPAFHHDCAAGTTVLSGSCTFLHLYWSSSTYAESSTSAWGVSFELGDVTPSPKATNFRVRAVRGGTP